jgi:hypothetical protein
MNKIKLHYPEGMTLHGVNACMYHPFEKYEPLKDKDETTMFWLYNPQDYELLAQHRGKKIICWCGSDVLHFNKTYQTKYLNLVRNPEITHIFLNKLQQIEMFTFGIYGEVRYIFWADPSAFTYSEELTKDCYVTCNKNAPQEYGEMAMNGLAWRYPDWTFHIFGITPSIPVYCKNVKYYGWIPETEMDDLTKNMAVCLRYNSHDGFPQTTCKALLRGQFALTQLPYDGMTIEFRTAVQLFSAFDAIIEDMAEGKRFDNHVRDMINNFDFIYE